MCIVWHCRGFYLECPGGELGKQKLQDMYGLLLPPGIARVFVDQLFGLFDSDKSGSVDFNVGDNDSICFDCLVTFPGVPDGH